MSLPAHWIDKIFNVLAIRYGRDFLNRWEGMPIADVKTDWGDVLNGFADDGKSIGWALDNLPDSRPPTAQDFRAICRRAPTPHLPRLEAPKANPVVVAQVLGGLRQPAPRVDGREWARIIIRRFESGEKLKPYTLRCAEQALRSDLMPEAA